MGSEDQGRGEPASQEGDRPLSEAVLGAWRADPDPLRAVALCSSVGRADVARRRDLVMAFGREVRAQCPEHLGALLAVARMYIVAEALSDAQSTLVSAATVAPEEPRTFALLGQVMLRLGDARRAVLAFEQATARGLTGPATRALFERAQYYAAIQDAQGEDAVAVAVREELTPPGTSGPPPPVSVGTPQPAGTSDAPGRADGVTPPTPAPTSDAAKRQNFVRTLIGFGIGGPIESPDEVEKVLSAFVGEEDRRAASPKDSPVQTSEPPPRPYSNRPGPKSEPPTTRYSVIKPEARSGASSRRRSDGAHHQQQPQQPQQPQRASGAPAKHRDFGEDTWDAPTPPPPRAREGGAGSAGTPQTSGSAGTPPTPSKTPERPGSQAPAPAAREPPGPFERISSPPPGGLAAGNEAVKATVRPKAKSKLRRWGIPAGVLVVAAFGIEAGRYLERAESARAAGALVQEADKAMHVGSIRSLGDAEAALRRANEADAASLEVALATVNTRLLRTLDSDETAPSLREAIDHARATSAHDRELAAAEIVMALAAKDGPRADELVKVHDDDRGRGLTAAAFYELAAGAALERRGDARAVERFQAAVRADPSLFPAEVRLVRAQLLYGDTSEGRRRARSLPAGRAEGMALAALGAYVADPSATSPPAPAAPEEELPRALRSIARALTLRAASESTGRGAAFAATIEAADAPAVAMFCGQLALAAGEPSSAEFAAKRAVELAPTFAPALALLARTALARGELDRMKESAAKLGGREGAELRAIAAYEDGDITQMEEILRAMSPQPTDSDAARIGIDRLRGAVIAGDRLKNVTKADPVWGELLKVDVALDIGDLDTAREISDGWALGSQHPLRALRLARRLRYEGRVDDAHRVMESAAPTRSALIERALLAGDVKGDRATVISALEVSTMPEKPWLIGYLKARQGFIDKAQKVLLPLELPPDSAPRSLRIAAALGMSELSGDRRGKPETQRLLDTWPKNPDVLRAAVGFEILPKTALKRRR